MAVDAGSIFSEVRVRLNKLNGDVESAKKEFDKLEKSAQKTGKAAGNSLDKGISKASDLIKSKLGPAVNLFGGIAGVASGAAIAAGAAIFKLGVNAGKAADQLLDLEQITGLSTDNLQRLKFVAADAGVSFEGLTGTITRFTARLPEIENGTGEASKAFEKLGISLRDNEGNLRSTNDLFFEGVKALQNVENVTERNTIAQQVFGRSLKDLAPVLGLTNKQFESLIKNADESGVVISKTALVAANAFRAELDKLSVVFASALQEIGTGFTPFLKDGLIPVLTALTSQLKSVSGAFVSLAEDSGNQSIKTGIDLISGAFKGIAIAIELASVGIRTFFNLFEATLLPFTSGIAAIKSAYEALETGNFASAGEAFKTAAKAFTDAGLKEVKDFGIGLGEEYADIGKRIAKIITGANADIAAAEKQGSPETPEQRAIREEKAADEAYQAWLDGIQNRVAAERAAIAEVDAATEKYFENIRKKQQETAAIATDLISGFGSIFDAASQFASAIADRQIREIERVRDARLEAAGVAEETEVERIQRELDEAILANDTALASDKRKELTRAQINEDAEREIARARYKGEMAAWVNTLSQIASTTALAIIAAKVNPSAIARKIATGIAIGTGAISTATAIANKPTPPAFETGGIVPGTSFSGDNNLARVNSGEMIINREQQARLFEMANGMSGGSNMMTVNIMIDDKILGRALLEKTSNGEWKYSTAGAV